MITTTTHSIDGKNIEQYLGVVSAEVIIGANVFKDILGGLRDFFGGRSGTYEKVLMEAKQNAMDELIQRSQSLGANAIVGIDLDFETVGSGGSMLMVIASGTAVRIR
ncbi:MAG TPA: heavy metal-binding domain-containing protein [Chitinophagaceae bacterium]|nr:heavy metal-binding domain-containing protein [Chitinophagaceae bacterium]